MQVIVRARRAVTVLAAITILSLTSAFAQQRDEPAEPFKIADNLYQVGSRDIGAYLITTPAGHMLIDGGYESTVPIIAANVAKLGFKLQDVKFLLNTQAHSDHAGGFAELKKRTGAQLVISTADAAVIERGGRADFSLGDSFLFPAVKVDRRIADGDTVSLGGTTLTAHLTPGHTQGCTTWTFDTRDASKLLHVVNLCGLAVLDNTRLSGDKASYPGIAADYERTFATLRALPVDVFIGAHVSYYNGLEKAARVKDGKGPNPFVDPDGYRSAIDRGEQMFRKRLAAEQTR